jgi:predicted short-subunit dehydrogenase-like oxidoreductase (DUF2520 family)
MLKPLINIIGAGKLGKTIGHLLVKNQLAHIGAILNSSQESSLKAIAFIGGGAYYKTIEAFPHADITLIATPDDLIPAICARLIHCQQLKPGAIFFHCSGALSSRCLDALKPQGCYVASIHPMHSFALPEKSTQTYPGTYCAMEGDPMALDSLQTLFTNFGSIPYLIDKNKKALYHAGGVFASNYLISLAQQAARCVEQSGVDNNTALNAILSLMESTLANLKQTQSLEKSLTGPIQRGDVYTLEKHLVALDDINKSKLYAVLGKATLELTHLDKSTTNRINKLFTDIN